MRILIVLVVALVLAGTATAATPRERVLQRQVKTLKASNVTLARQVRTLKNQRQNLSDEVARLRQLILDSVQSLSNAWLNDGNPQTGVSYYSSGDDYWSYSFTWCGFCTTPG